jgi:TRAP-type C4-dicarboxylate transport system substrate-binding protein
MSVLLKSVAALGVTGLLTVPAIAQTKWDMPVPYNEGNFHTQNILQFAKDVSAATGGKLTIQVHPAGSLFKHPEIKPSVRRGLAPIGEILASLASNESPIYGVDSVPFLTGGYADSKKLYAAQKPFLEKKLESEGLKLLYSVAWPPQGLFARKEIKSLDDMSGLKFRTYNAATSRLAQLIRRCRRRSRPLTFRPPSRPAAWNPWSRHRRPASTAKPGTSSPTTTISGAGSRATSCS